MDVRSIGNWGTGFLRSQLSDKDGTVSNTKVCIFAVFAAIIGWISCLIFKMRTPVTVTDLVTFLGAAGTFIVVSCGPLMGIKAAGDAINNRAPNAGPQLAPPPPNPAP